MLQESSLAQKKKKKDRSIAFFESYSPGLAIAASVLVTSLKEFVSTQKMYSF